MPTTSKRSPRRAAATITLPVLKKGEIHAGIALKDGKPSHHLILIPGEKIGVTFDAAGAWAKKQGGDLPTRQEQSLLFANARAHFQAAWYWSGEQHASDSASAWSQTFTNGYQTSWPKDYKYRAVAVRRVPI